MTSLARLRSTTRLLAMFVLAYVLVLNGLLGSISAGAHVSEARTAAKLGVICTIHGIASAEGGREDPTPGKLACIEHCVLAAASTMPVVPSTDAGVNRPLRLAEATRPQVRTIVHWIAPGSTLPQPRGPPSLI
jgi:hypothetical protein